jgi:chemosensory pili system protein ChpA (sensor histidine kinase/response regulator)
MTRSGPPGLVLVVDDDADFRETVMLILSEHGWEVRTAGDGVQALALLRGGLRPDLILLDLFMPVMGGMEVCHELLHDPELRHIPVAILSGDNAAFDRAPPPGVRLLSKPVRLDVLLAVVGASHEQNV